MSDADAKWRQRPKLEGAEFHALADRYYAVTELIHRIESGIVPVSDAPLEALKRERLAILDEVGALVPGRQAA